MNELILNSETRQDKIVFSNALNNHNTLFGGIAMKWMDEVAYITAIRFSKKKMVTVSADKIQFLAPIKVGSIVEILGKVIKVGVIKITIQVDINIQDINTGKRTKATSAMFTFAAVDESNKPILVEEKLHTEMVFQDR